MFWPLGCGLSWGVILSASPRGFGRWLSPMLSWASLNTVHASFPPGPWPRTNADSTLESCAVSLHDECDGDSHSPPSPGTYSLLQLSPQVSTEACLLGWQSCLPARREHQGMRQRTSTTTPTTLTARRAWLWGFRDLPCLPWYCLCFQVKLPTRTPLPAPRGAVSKPPCGEHSGGRANSLRPKAFLLCPESLPLAHERIFLLKIKALSWLNIAPQLSTHFSAFFYSVKGNQKITILLSLLQISLKLLPNRILFSAL